ncbi:MAG TPA: regulatory protein RecX [Jiangellales bacterium]|nr:regulatory protein RecX [Jiangellales bacterium]
MRDADADAVARSVALRRLTVAPQTRAQLTQALQRRRVPDDVSAAVLDRLAEVGLIDDAAFADAWVETRHAGRGLARRALAHELRHRGVPDDLVDDALDRLSPDEERATALALVRARLPATRRLAPLTRRRRLLGLLARKGYPAGLAASVVREALTAESEDLATDEDDDVGWPVSGDDDPEL